MGKISQGTHNGSLIDNRNVAWPYRLLGAYADAIGLECASMECVLAAYSESRARHVQLALAVHF
jgi:hypothetical protein